VIKRSNDSSPKNPPRFVLTGRQEVATYTDPVIADYRGNPLIEALPPIWTRDEVEQRLEHYPAYSKGERNLPNQIRNHLTENSREFFVPQGIHFEIETRISCMIRRGYLQRNPMDFGYWPDLGRRLDSFQASQSKAFLQSKARGYATVGHSGMGKTTATEKIVLQYPQVISHSKYQEHDLILKQLVWLKLDCPQDGSIKGLCLNFFEAVDHILGTNYERNYATGRATTVDVLLLRMARVAALHSIGVLIIDEVQNLSAAKSGGVSQMLNFFVQLENIIGVPFILIGTQQALPLLKGEFRQARRMSEQGDVVWERMREVAERNPYDEEDKADPQWESFVRALFIYDYLRIPSLLKANLLQDPLSRALYKESQGITAVAATIYMLAQRRAISSGLEKMTVSIIRSATQDGQHLVGTMLEELRAGGIRARSSDLFAAKDLFDVKQNTPARQREIFISKADAAGVEEVQANATAPIGEDTKHPKSSGTKKRLARSRKNGGEQCEISSQSYDEEDLRKLAEHPETTTSSKSKHIRSLTHMEDGNS
jgi:hypothetical protein